MERSLSPFLHYNIDYCLDPKWKTGNIAERLQLQNYVKESLEENKRYIDYVASVLIPKHIKKNLYAEVICQEVKELLASEDYNLKLIRLVAREASTLTCVNKIVKSGFQNLKSKCQQNIKSFFS